MLWQTGKVVLDVNECFQICYAHSNAAAREEFFNSPAAVNAQTVPGAYEAIQALRAMNFEVHAVTARPISAQSMTHQFLTSKKQEDVITFGFLKTARLLNFFQLFLKPKQPF